MGHFSKRNGLLSPFPDEVAASPRQSPSLVRILHEESKVIRDSPHAPDLLGYLSQQA
jgi:hypothetical protein